MGYKWSASDLFFETHMHPYMPIMSEMRPKCFLLDVRALFQTKPNLLVNFLDAFIVRKCNKIDKYQARNIVSIYIQDVFHYLHKDYTDHYTI